MKTRHGVSGQLGAPQMFLIIDQQISIKTKQEVSSAGSECAADQIATKVHFQIKSQERYPAELPTKENCPTKTKRKHNTHDPTVFRIGIDIQ